MKGISFFTHHVLQNSELQARSWLDNWGGAHIHIFVFADHKNNPFQKKLIVQNISPPPNYRAGHGPGELHRPRPGF